jgi:cytochrome c-type protein NapC
LDKKPAMLKRTWSFLRQPSAKCSVLTIGVVCIFAGIILWGGFNTALEATNKLEFCISCHEMRDTVYREYKKTRHYSNRIGVRAICSDCHMPRDLSREILQKILGTRELWGKITGSVDTTEKFEGRRMELATRVWARMKASNSRECRNCHNFDALNKTTDKLIVYEKHMKAKDEGKTCIDCHKGIAHLLPREYVDPDEE